MDAAHVDIGGSAAQGSGSLRTFANYGSGSTLFWVDPELEMTFVCLSAGVMQPAPNIERFQRLSDIAASAAL